MYHIRRKKFYELHQWANDWVMATGNEILSPTSLVFTLNEYQRMIEDKHAGMFWSIYEPVTDIKYIEFGGFRFKKRRLPVAGVGENRV